MSGKRRHLFRTPGELKKLGIIGINMRNGRFLLPNNPRRLYGLVDDKVRAKGLAVERGIAVPETYAVMRDLGKLRLFDRMMKDHNSFVIKPIRGSGGKGVLVVDGRDGENYKKPSGSLVTPDEVRWHLQNILAGLFSLGGQRDGALIEYKVEAHPTMMSISFQGAPDVRVILYHGYPVLTMLRAATRESDGRSNLHQGALGVGVDVISGVTTHAVHHNKRVEIHPDLKKPLIGVQIPEWDQILDIATTCYDITGLGYLGVDLMIDRDLGPLMIEINARPGLAIQLANGIGLRDRLLQVEKQQKKFPNETAMEKIAFARKAFQSEHTKR